MSFEGYYVAFCKNGHEFGCDVYDFSVSGDKCPKCSEKVYYFHIVDQTNGDPAYEDDFFLGEYLAHVMGPMVKRMAKMEDILKEINEDPPTDVDIYNDSEYCKFCGSYSWEDHDEDCTLMKIRKVLDDVL